MPLELTRPLISLDTETTGAKPNVDRIVQIGVVKVMPDGTQTEWETLINPEVHITPFITKIHGIDDEMVKDAPKFSYIAPILAQKFSDVDFCGYNLEFDLNFLIAEFERAGVQHTLRDVKVADAFEVYKLKRPRNLSSAIQDILGEELKGAHTALADARGTYRLLNGLIDMFPDLPNTVDGLHDYVFNRVPEGYLDRQKRIAWVDGVATLSFGKFSGKALADVNHHYLHWIIDGNFPLVVKQFCNRALEGKVPTEEEWRRENSS